jgi:hypothetical protein
MTLAPVGAPHDGPLGVVLAKAGRTQRAGRGLLARCPAHRDGTPSLSINTGEDGRVLLNCHAGCNAEAIVAAWGLSLVDLFPERPEGFEAGSARGVHVADLSSRLRLPTNVLPFFGVRDGEYFGRACVEIPYPRRDGTEARARLRIAQTGDRFRWKGKEGSVIAYEPDRGELAAQQRELTLVEGETDTLTLLYAGFAALEVPGANSVHTIEQHHLEQLERVYVVHEPDTGGETFVAGVRERLRKLGFAGAVHVLPMPDKAKDPNALWQREPDLAKFRAKLEGAMRAARAADEPAPHPLTSVWRTLGELGALTTVPAPRRWLLTRPDDETNGTTAPIGVLQLGKVGLLVAAGGAGKTMALVELALAVATGRKWLDYFEAPNPGRVLIALGEEDADEAARRFYWVAQAMRLTEHQLEAAAANVVVLPLAGVSMQLVHSDGSNTVASEAIGELRRRLSEHEWRLVILDPLSRFAGADTEKDNAAATRFIQVVESLVQVPGSPTVLVAHHTNKLSRAEGSKASAANARGASAITDGGRWVAELESLGDDGARLTFTKSNYGRLGAPVDLVRDAAHGGYLRVATPEEVRRSAQAGTQRESARVLALADRAAAWLGEHPGAPKSMIAAGLRVRDRDAALAIDHLVRVGRAVLISRYGYSLASEEAAG